MYSIPHSYVYKFLFVWKPTFLKFGIWILILGQYSDPHVYATVRYQRVTKMWELGPSVGFISKERSAGTLLLIKRDSGDLKGAELCVRREEDLNMRIFTHFACNVQREQIFSWVDDLISAWLQQALTISLFDTFTRKMFTPWLRILLFSCPCDPFSQLAF